MTSVDITTTTTAAAWSPDVYSFAPTDAVPEALINQCATLGATVEGDAPSVRAAYIVDDTAEFVPEGTLLPENDPQMNEVLVHTAKVTQFLTLSREQWSQTGTAQQLSDSVSRALTRRGDIAFVAEPAPTPPAVAPMVGLFHAPGIIDGGSVATSLDALVDLVAQLQRNKAVPTQILLDPLGWAGFRKLKVGGTNTNESLLGAGTNDAAQLLLSLPVLVNIALDPYTGLVVDKNAIVAAVGNVQVATSEHAAFQSDAIAIRATWRFGHAVVRPERIGKFTIAHSGS